LASVNVATSAVKDLPLVASGIAGCGGAAVSAASATLALPLADPKLIPSKLRSLTVTFVVYGPSSG
jgi:hypothetical protein